VAAKAPQIALTGLAIAFVFAFLFTTVAALATAMTGNNPISGMTLVTLIIGSSALVAVGLQGEFGKYAAIVMGAVVCTSLSMAGGFVTDLKVGYWLGATPRHQEISKVIGTLFAAVGVALTVLLIHQAYGHTDAATGQFVTGFLDPRVPAPQANLFATILSGIFDQAPVTWLLYSVGLVLSLLLLMMGIPPLAFAIGMYLPLQINTPLFVGGLISHWVGKSSKDAKVSEARSNRGTLLASGFIAGGALAGVAGAVLNLIKTGIPDPSSKGDFKSIAQLIDLPAVMNFSADGDWPQIISIMCFVGLCCYLYYDAKRAKA
jgi:putative OPT family oligopeptide transporter